MAFDIEKATVPQKNAIYTSSGTLVSAAAGSGKTAVLVERVIEKLCGKNPIDADRLLIVTFTNAAAEEMYSRIEKRLNEEFAKYPENRNILKQRYKLREANICTIDSFCINLVRENFEKVGVSPDFTIADNSLLKILSDNTMNTVLNKAFNKMDEDFSALLEGLTGDFDEANLKKAIYNINEFAKNMPFPSVWLSETSKKILSDDFEDIVFNDLMSSVKESLKCDIISLNNALASLQPLEKVYKSYCDNFKNTIDCLGLALKRAEEKNWDGLFTTLNNISFASLSTPRDGSKDLTAVISAVSVRNNIKDKIGKIYKNLIYAPLASVKSDYQISKTISVKLLELASEYYEEFYKNRKENNTLSFDDTEHLALSLLCSPADNGEITGTDSAKEIINRFDEVLVDEFQDTNDMQNMLFDVISNNQENLFVVGDIKQSIYRFRGANPENFLKKIDDYISYEDNQNGVGKKIILGKNFRSRKGICDFVNSVFSLLMNRKDSRIKYSRDDELVFGANFPEKPTNDVKVVLTNVDKSETILEADAKSISDFIIDSIQNDFITDTATGELRHPTFSDFTILLREMAANGVKYAQEFRKYGIPVSYNIKGFLDFYEIQMILSLLAVIENPTRDISMAAVLMSPLFRFSADEMAELRIAKRRGNLFSALSFYAEKNEKCKSFTDKLKKFRTLSSSRKISDLVHEIYAETDILNIVSVLEKGENRRKNLEFFMGLAVDYDANGFSRNISSFMKYVERLGTDIKAAGYSAGENSITLSTVHSSKGLQYPICILADTASTFNNKDFNSELLCSLKYGVGFKFLTDNGLTKKDSLVRMLISQDERLNQFMEEMRLLYVALTRAEEKLAIFITKKDVTNLMKYNAYHISTSENLEGYLSNPNIPSSYAEMIIYALMPHPAMTAINMAEDISGFLLPADNKIDILLQDSSDILPDVTEFNAESTQEEAVVNESLLKELKDGIEFNYQFEELKEIESKAAAAVIAHKAETKDYSFTSLPSFMNKKGISPTKKGTAIHRFMQFCDFENAKTDLHSEIERLYEWEFITLTEKEAIDDEPLKAFFEGPLFKRIEVAETVEREMRFLTELPAGEINRELTGLASEQNVVIQGSVDCVFQEQDGIVVVDFKTDRVKNEKDLVESYSAQLEIYAMACAKIFGKPVKEKIIHSFTLNKSISF